MRSILDRTIVSTLPHFTACYFAAQVSPYYISVIVASSTASVLWHLSHEPMYNWLFYLDYGLAGLWFVADVFFAFRTWDPAILVVTVFMNTVVLLANIIKLDAISYETTHTIWHCISWLKAIIVSVIISEHST